MKDINGIDGKLLNKLENESIKLWNKLDTLNKMGSNFNFEKRQFTVCGGYPVSRCGTNTIISVAQWENPITGIPRDADIVIKTGDGQIFELHTPMTQSNYFVNCIGNPGHPPPSSCTSNFGYSYP